MGESAEVLKGFSTYTYGEGRTGVGQMVEFTCRPEERSVVSDFLAKHVRTIGLPTTGRVEVPHGGYGQYTRYKVKQHKYAGGNGEDGHGGYIEVLEITDPPDGRWGIVIHEYTTWSGSVFTEWETLEDADAAFEKCWSGFRKSAETMPGLKGFKRRVVVSHLKPWFYAIGEEELIGDMAFPHGLEDDPVFRFGEKFVVMIPQSGDSLPVVKTCVGARVFQERSAYYPHKAEVRRIVFWDDGTVWEAGKDGPIPRKLEAGEMWIAQAMEEFKRLLAGRSTGFTIDFTNGDRFVGRLKRRSRVPSGEGDYDLLVTFKGKVKPQRGWINGFAPTEEYPDIAQFVRKKFAKLGKDVERVEVKKFKKKNGGKGWKGAFFAPSRTPP